MDVNALKTFIKIVQTGSFTLAAQQMGSQKAHLSRVMTQLEQELGLRLLVRSTRSLSLTEVGREMFERAISIVAAIEEAERFAQNVHSEPRGTLKLTCGVEFGQIAVSRWISHFLAEFPHVNIEADYTNRIVDIVHEGFDLAIRVGPLSDSNLAARPLGQLRYGLFAAPAYLDRFSAPAAPEDLSQHRCLHFSFSATKPQWRLLNGEQEKRIELNPRLRINNSFAILDAACNGLGIAQLPFVVAQAALKLNQLQPVLPDWSPPVVPVHAVFPSTKYVTPKVRQFIDFAVTHFERIERVPLG